MEIYKSHWFCKYCESGSGTFYARKTGRKITVYMVCIICHRENRRAYQAKNYQKKKAEYRKTAKAWREKNRKRYNKTQREYYKRKTRRDI